MANSILIPTLCRTMSSVRQLVVLAARTGARGAHSQVAVKTIGGAAGVGSGSQGDDGWHVHHSSQLPKAIIFDKNGTLINFPDEWSPWIQSIVNRLEKATGLRLEQQVFQQLDFCRFTNKTRSGLLGHGSQGEIKQELESILVSQGWTRQKSHAVIKQCWEDCTTRISKLEPIGNLPAIMKQLQRNDMQVALCTSDSRANTEQTLEELRIHQLVDTFICGDDLDCKPKPDGSNIRLLCQRLGILPNEAIIIGDSQADMQMGVNAGTGLNIAVLSGVGNRLDFVPVADLVVDSVNDLLPLLFNCSPNIWQRRQPKHEVSATVRRVAKEQSKAKPGKKASLVIFDKDGTLICFHSMWTPWAEAFMDRLEKETGLELRDKMLHELGYCVENQKWTPGIFAEGTVTQNKAVVVATLVKQGLSPEEAYSVLQKTWVDGDHSKGKQLKTLDNPASLFRSLKQHGIKVAICTADARGATEQFMESEGLAQYVDTLVCGDDADNVPKPSPHNARLICERLRVDPTEAVVIGDTVADMGMGRSAHLGATVGVLSGVGDVEDLDPQADHIVPSIEHILNIVIEGDHSAPSH